MSDGVLVSMMRTQDLIGGYMYLRSLMGPGDVLFKFYDDPGLIHDCMKAWLDLADAVTARHQQHVTIDELFLAEDICFRSGPLISPDMMREFLFPYYRQLIKNIRARQLDRSRHLYIQIDTDGYAVPVIPVYREIGMDVMSPFEAAAGCDVVEIGRQYPELVLSGGIDKRILARSTDAIDREVERILPVMRRPGGIHPHVRPRRSGRSPLQELPALQKSLRRARRMSRIRTAGCGSFPDNTCSL